MFQVFFTCSLSIYVDAVVNHMTGHGAEGTGTGGSYFNGGNEDYPGRAKVIKSVILGFLRGICSQIIPEDNKYVIFLHNRFSSSTKQNYSSTSSLKSFF